MWLLPFSNHSAAPPIATTAQDTLSSAASSTDNQQKIQQQTYQLALTAGLPSSGPTLLPGRIASLVSLFTKSTTLSIRLSSLIGQLVIDSARTTTLSSLELARAGVEGVLLRAFHDVEDRRIALAGGSAIDHGWTESMLNKLHAVITLSQLLVSTGFEASSTGLNAVKDLSQGWIYVVDSIFGETESSRAIKSILSLIIQEFGTSENKSLEGSSVGVVDLLAGLACFAILQKRGRRRRAKEIRLEVIWDVVVGDFGTSFVGGKQHKGSDRIGAKRPNLKKLRSVSTPTVMTQSDVNPDNGDTWTRVRTGDDDNDDDSILSGNSDSEETDSNGPDSAVVLKDELASWLQKLPPSAQASISSTTTTTRRTTVEVTGLNGDPRGQTMDLEFAPPKDAIVLAEESHHSYADPDSSRGDMNGAINKYRVVYETVHRKGQVKRVRRETEGGRLIVENANNGNIDDDVEMVMMDDIPRHRPMNLTRAISAAGDLFLPPKEPSIRRSRSEKHVLDESKATERELKREKKDKSGKDKNRTSDKSKDKPKKDKEKNKHKKDQKERKHREKKSDEISSSRKSLDLAHTHMPSQPPLITPPSPWLGSSSDYFSMTPASPEYTKKRSSRSSSLTRTTSTYLDPNSGSRAESIITQRQETIQSPSGGIQLRRQYSREVLPLGGGSRPSTSGPPPVGAPMRHDRSNYAAPSIHTLRTTHSSTSLSLEYGNDISVRDDMLGRSYFPHDHLCRNMSKFMRFASASYGSNFMRFLGIGAQNAAKAAADGDSPTTSLVPAAVAARSATDDHHPAHHSFSFHTSLPVDTILLSSFTDPGGGYDMHGDVNTGVPLVHFICVDHKAKAIVLTCRGTLGLDDVVTDLTCEYGDMEVRGKTYRVHKGMLNSAILLLKTRRAKVLQTLRDALVRHEGYGLVFCGHSLGGGVASILAILLSTPTSRGGFTTSNTVFQDVYLPEGRPVHCYAYGSPACVCEKLRKETTGLITSIVHGRDIVPSLSFGMIRDFHSVALAFKDDTQGIRKEIGKTVLGDLTRRATGFGSTDDGVATSSANASTAAADNGARAWASGGVLFEDRDDDYLYSILKTLRAGMNAEKLVPPGEVYVIETQTVFQQSRDGGIGIKPSTRVTTRVVKDVEKRFCEITFGRGMFADHSPANYEGALEMLLRGVCDEEVAFT